ncbi:hypothetical protein PAPYR_3011 [Paratrimastix pyriformis]|uniref:Post-GPI attachment to proteins factor 3 n=1 Tax=Paratrimastix pyriformis TaxID=342808 RepID=A0ABQ8UNK8_9EUKA|nr:hypothetical protein PAPYR_3011 [Paratrimastix pyriformis]
MGFLETVYELSDRAANSGIVKYIGGDPKEFSTACSDLLNALCMFFFSIRMWKALPKHHRSAFWHMFFFFLSSVLGFFKHAWYQCDDPPDFGFYLWKVDVAAVYACNLFATYFMLVFCPHKLPGVRRGLRWFVNTVFVFFMYVLLSRIDTPFLYCGVAVLISVGSGCITAVLFGLFARRAGPATPAEFSDPANLCALSVQPPELRVLPFRYFLLYILVVFVAFALQISHISFPPWLTFNVLFHWVILASEYLFYRVSMEVAQGLLPAADQPKPKDH